MLAVALAAGVLSVAALALTAAYQRATARARRDLVFGAFVSVVTVASLLAVVVLG